MNEINVRESNENDLEQIITIGESIFSYEYNSKTKEQSLIFFKDKLGKILDKIYVAYTGDKILGFAIYSPEGLTATHKLFQIGIIKEVQGQGIGEILLKESIDLYVKNMKKLGIDVYTIYLTTSSDNPAGQNLYHKLGFVEVGRMKDTFMGRGNVEVVMTKFFDDRKYPTGIWNEDNKE